VAQLVSLLLIVGGAAAVWFNHWYRHQREQAEIAT
jgi:hypothetical protein